jgi:hypothetical protein
LYFLSPDLHRKIALRGVAAFEAVAKDGTGVLQTLTTISKRVIRSLRERTPNAAAATATAARPALGRSAPSAAPARLAPPPGTTQLIDRAAFEASLAKPPPGTTQQLERIVSPEDSQPGMQLAPATFADTVAETESLFDAGFEGAKRAAAAKSDAATSARPAAARPAVPTVELEADDADSGLTIEPAGPAQPAPGGLRIPLFVRDARGIGKTSALSRIRERAL